MKIKGRWIFDDAGRTLILRGCNLGGSSKVPGTGTEAGEISFTGRPFPLEEADEHFACLAAWGFTFLRFVLTWEALEHEGPGIYDEAYLAYLRKLFTAAEKQGVSVVIDPHQDVWSRPSGGDGAPFWTLEKLGMDTALLEKAGARLPGDVLFRNHPPGPKDGASGDHCYPPTMLWPAGYNRYAAASMFTLFFAGDAYAPETRIDGESAQTWLQTRYIEAFVHARRRLKNCKAIAAWGTMNEPHPGFIGCRNLANLENNLIAAGPMPSSFEAMAAASGYTMEVPVYTTGIFGVRKTGKTSLNPQGISIFKEGFYCPWKAAGIWTAKDDTPRLLKADHFAHYKERPARFGADFLNPFINRLTARLGEADEKLLFFIEGVPAGLNAGEAPETSGTLAETAAGRLVHGFHWYDGPTLFLRQFRPWLSFDVNRGKPVFGRKAVAALFHRQMAERAVQTEQELGIPAYLGEFGLPFDLFHGRSFKTGDYSVQEEALAMYYDVIDALFLGSAVWNYSACNTNAAGDFWNDEDFSFVSRGADPAGPLLPRAAAGWLRPYPAAVAGTPLHFRWDRKRRRLYFRFRANPAIAAPTEIFVPDGCFGPGADPALTVSDGPGISAEYRREERRIVITNTGFAGEVTVHAAGAKR